MSKISNYQELIAERTRLEGELQQQKNFLKIEMNALKVKIEPLGDLISFLGIFKKKEAPSSPLLKAGLSVGIDLLVRDNLLAKSNWMARMFVPAILKLVSSQFIKKKKLTSDESSVQAVHSNKP